VNPSKLSLRLVLLSLRRRIRCDDNLRKRGFLVVATTRSARPHIRPPHTAVRRACPVHRLAIRVRVRVHAPTQRGQS
jgi:hypothetical protein